MIARHADDRPDADARLAHVDEQKTDVLPRLAALAIDPVADHRAQKTWVSSNPVSIV